MVSYVLKLPQGSKGELCSLVFPRHIRRHSWYAGAPCHQGSDSERIFGHIVLV